MHQRWSQWRTTSLPNIELKLYPVFLFSFFLFFFIFYYIQFLVLLPVLIAVWAGHHLQLFQRELRHSQASKEMPSLQLYPAVSSRKTLFGVLFLFVLQNHFSMPRNIWFNKKKKEKVLIHLWKKPNLKVSGEWGDANLFNCADLKGILVI